MDPADLSTAQIAAFEKAEVEKWAQIIKVANIKPERVMDRGAAPQA